MQLMLGYTYIHIKPIKILGLKNERS